MSSLDEMLAEEAAHNGPASLSDIINQESGGKVNYVSPAVAETAPPGPGPDTTSMAQRFGTGVMDPVQGGAQLLSNSVRDLSPDTYKKLNSFNNSLAEATGDKGAALPPGGVDEAVRTREADYRKARGDQADNFDAWRTAGNAFSPVNLATAAIAPATLPVRLSTALAQGALSSMFSPVTGGEPEDYWNKKLLQTSVGTLFGGLGSKLFGGAGSVISPAASKNAQLKYLTDRGVEPTIGQSLGGAWDSAERIAAHVVPLMGPMIVRARNNAEKQLENVAINESQRPIGTFVSGTGLPAVGAAKANNDAAYDAARAALGGMRLDPQFHSELASLRDASSGLTPKLQNRFEKFAQDNVLGKASPAPGLSPFGRAVTPPTVVLPDTLKTIQRDIDAEAASKSLKVGGSGEDYSDIIKQLGAQLDAAAYRSNPRASNMLDAADLSFANLVRAQTAASNPTKSGHFDPFDLSRAVARGDTTGRNGRKIDFSKGDALMQDLSDAGINVLGPSVHTSPWAQAFGTAGLVGSSLYHPAGLLGAGGALTGALAYTHPAQSALRFLATKRYPIAQPIAGALSRLAPGVAPAVGLIAGEKVD